MSAARYENPLIVQSDHTVLVEVDSPRYVEGRDALGASCRTGEVTRACSHLPDYAPLDLERMCRRGDSELDRDVARGLQVRCAARCEIEIAEYASATED